MLEQRPIQQYAEKYRNSVKNIYHTEAFIIAIIVRTEEAEQTEIINKLVEFLPPNILCSVFEKTLHKFTDESDGERKIRLDFALLATGSNSILNKELARFRGALNSSDLDTKFSLSSQLTTQVVKVREIKEISEKLHKKMGEFYQQSSLEKQTASREKFASAHSEPIAATEKMCNLIKDGVPITVIENLCPEINFDAGEFTLIMLDALAKYKENQRGELTKKQQAIAIRNSIRFIEKKCSDNKDEIIVGFGKKLVALGFPTYILSKAGLSEEIIKEIVKRKDVDSDDLFGGFDNKVFRDIEAVLSFEEEVQQIKEKLQNNFSGYLRKYVEFLLKINTKSLYKDSVLNKIPLCFEANIIIAAINECRTDFDTNHQQRLAILLLKNGIGKELLQQALFTKEQIEQAEKLTTRNISQGVLNEKIIAYFMDMGIPLGTFQEENIRKGLCFGYSAYKNLIVQEKGEKYYEAIVNAVIGWGGKSSYDDTITFPDNSSRKRGEVIKSFHEEVIQYQDSQYATRFQIYGKSHPIENHEVVVGKQNRALVAKGLRKIEKFFEKYSAAKISFLVIAEQHACRFFYDPKRKVWSFFDPNDEVGEEEFKNMDDFIERMIQLSPKEDYAVHAMSSEKNLGLEKLFTEIKQLSYLEMVTGYGLYLIAGHDHEFLQDIVVKAKEDEELRRSIAEALMLYDNDGRTVLHLLVVSHSTESLLPLLELAKTDDVLRKSIEEALVLYDNDGRTVLHLLVDSYSTEILLPLLELAKTDDALRKSIGEALMLYDNDGRTVLHLLVDRHSTESLLPLLELAKTDDVLRKSIGEALVLQDNAGLPVLHVLAKHSPNGLLSLFELAKTDDVLRKSIGEALMLQDNAGLTILHVLAKYSTTGLLSLLELAKTDDVLRKSIGEALMLKNNDGLTGSHFLAFYSIKRLLSLFELAKTDDALRKSIGEALMFKNNIGLPVLHVLAKYSTTGLLSLFELAKTDDVLRKSIGEALMLQDNAGLTILHVLAKYSTTGLLSLLELARKDSELMRLLAEALQIKDKYCENVFFYIKQYCPQTLTNLCQILPSLYYATQTIQKAQLMDLFFQEINDQALLSEATVNPEFLIELIIKSVNDSSLRNIVLNKEDCFFDFYTNNFNRELIFQQEIIKYLFIQLKKIQNQGPTLFKNSDVGAEKKQCDDVYQLFLAFKDKKDLKEFKPKESDEDENFAKLYELAVGLSIVGEKSRPILSTSQT